MEESKTSNNKNILIGLVSVVVVALLGFFIYNSMLSANADDICILNVKEIQKETKTSSCTNGSWSEWKTDPENPEQEKRTYTGNLTTTDFVLETERKATKEETSAEIEKSNDGYDEKHYNYVTDEEEMGGFVCNADHDLGGAGTENDHHDDLIAEGWTKGEHIDAREDRDKSKGEARSQDGWVYTKTITKTIDGHDLEGKAGVTKTVTDIACQVVQTRKGCDKEFYPTKDAVCKGESFVQRNDCGDTRDVTGTKTCEDDTCKDTSWSPSTDSVCRIDGTFVQVSNCGNVRTAQGTNEDEEKCGEVIVDKCKDENGNVVPGTDADGDGYCDDNGNGGGDGGNGGGNDNLTLEMSCSLDGRIWSECDSKVWRLKSKRSPIKVRIIPTEGTCSNNVNPAFSDTTDDEISLNFSNLKKIDNSYVTDSKLVGKVPTEVFKEKVKATYCGDNSVEKELEIKVLDINIIEN